MKQIVKFLSSALLSVLLSGCLLLNGVSLVPANAEPSEDSTLLLLGIAVEGEWKFPKFGISFDEYDLSKQQITGNCWRYNHIEASTSATESKIQYFVFEAPSGLYTYSGFNAPGLSPPALPGFVVPEGKFTYLGDFIFTKAKKLEIRQDIGTARKQVSLLWPNIHKELLPAASINVPPSRLFLCAP